MVDKKDLCTKYLKAVGRPMLYIDNNDNQVDFFAVIQQTWRKNKTRFEDIKSQIGRVNRDYYLYLGPYHINIEALPEDRAIICDGVRYLFVKKDKVKIGDNVQFYTGVMRQIWEDEDDYFE